MVGDTADVVDVAPAVVGVVVAPTLVVVVVAAAHTGLVIVLVSSVTAPLRASALPFRVAPVVMLIDVSARMLPTKALPVPIVAELRILSPVREFGAGELVEATGVEPVSEKTPTKASTSLARVFFLATAYSPSSITAAASPDLFSESVETPGIVSRLV